MTDLTTETRRLVRAALSADRAAREYFVEAPLVIDCTNDAADFVASVTHERRQVIAERYASGELRYVGALWGHAKDYAMRKLKERFATLDRETVLQLEQLLKEWSAERDRLPAQLSRPDGYHGAGVDIILPLNGIRLSYGFECLLVL